MGVYEMGQERSAVLQVLSYTGTVPFSDADVVESWQRWEAVSSCTELVASATEVEALSDPNLFGWFETAFMYAFSRFAKKKMKF